MAATDRSARGWALVVAMLAAVVAIAYGYVLFGGQTFGGDHLLVELPSRSYLADAIASGRLPEWWPSVGLGVPFAANPDHLALYPPAWLVALVPMPWGADALLVLHALLAGIGTAVLAQRLGADRLGAIVAGGAFATCGALGGSVGHAATVLSLAWVPWMLGVAIGIAQATTWRDRSARVVWMSCVTAAALLAGDVSVVLAGGALAVGLAVVLARGPWVASAAATALGVLAGVIPAAVLLVPAANLGLLSLDGFGGDVARMAAYVWPGAAALYVGLPMVLLAGLSVASRERARRLAIMVVVIIGAGVALWAPLGVVACALLCALGGRGVTDVAAWRLGRARLERIVPAAVAAVALGVTIASSLGRGDLRPRAEIAARPAVLPAEKGSSPPPRIYRPRAGFMGRFQDRSELADYALAPANSATRFGFAYARGRDRAVPPRVGATWLAAAVASEAFFDLYDVAYMLVPTSVVFPSGMTVVGRSPDGRLALVHNKRRRARAFVAPRWQWHASDALLRGHLFAPGRGLRLTAVQLIGTGPPAPPRRGVVPAPACATEYPRPEHVRLRCDSSTGGYAVLLDGWSPGWSATVDGSSVPIVRADSLVRAVRVEPGEHLIEMHYRTPGLGLGALVSLLAFLNALVLLVVWRRRSSR